MSGAAALVSSARLREVFGVFPSGVVAIAALRDGEPVGMTASSFTSVSLDPALVSVCITRTSRTYGVLRPAPRLGISILAADQEPVGRQLASGSADRFAGVPWRATPDGAVLLDGAAGWLDTAVDHCIAAGDHDVLILRVHDLDADHSVRPLVFHASTYTGVADRGVTPPARHVRRGPM